MKHKQGKLVFFFFLLLAIYQLTIVGVAQADTTTIDELVPNDYQKNQFKINKDLLHDNSSTNQRTNIPEEQKELTFKGEKTSRDNDLKEELFLSQAIDQNTIKAKAVNMQLFSTAESSTIKQTEEDPSSSSNLSLTILIWILVGICSLLLIVVLFTWGNSSVKQKSPQNV